MSFHFSKRAAQLLFIWHLVFFVSLNQLTAETTGDVPPPQFSREIVPILVEKCLGCHDDKTSEGGYSVSTWKSIKTSGDSGSIPISSPAENSELFNRLITEDVEKRMPADGEPLPKEEIELIRRWLNSGASADVDDMVHLAELPSVIHDTFQPPEHYATKLPISAIAIDPTLEQVAVSGYGEVLLWKLSDSQLLGRIPTKGRRITDIDISNGGRTLAIASGVPGRFGAVEIFLKDETGTWVHQFVRMFADTPLDVKISPNEAWTLIGQANGTVRVIANAMATDVHVLDSHAAAITSVAWSDDSTKFYSASRDRSAKSYEADSGKIIASYAEHERVVSGVAPSQRGIYSLDETGQLRSWTSGINPNAIASISGLSQRTNKLVHFGDRIAVADQQTIHLYRHVTEEVPDGNDDQGNPKTKKKHYFEESIAMQAASLNILCVDMKSSGDGGLTRIVAGASEGTIHIFDGQSSSPVQSLYVLP